MTRIRQEIGTNVIGSVVGCQHLPEEAGLRLVRRRSVDALRAVMIRPPFLGRNVLRYYYQAKSPNSGVATSGAIGRQVNNLRRQNRS